MAITAAVREALASKPEEFDPRHVAGASRAGMKEIVAERMRRFGPAGHAGDYAPLALAEMRRLYGAVDRAAVSPAGAIA